MILQLTRYFCWAIVAVALANGATAYMKRVGWLDRAAYNEYVSIYCDPPTLPCSCMRDPTGANANSDEPNEAATGSLPSRRYVYEVRGFEHALKPIKDGLFAGFFALSLGLIATRRTLHPALGRLTPLLPLLISMGVGLVIALSTWGVTMAALGLRPFAFLGVAILGGWIVSQLANVSKALVVLLVAQVALVLVEFWVGIPLRYCDLGFRAAGTLVIANSLGVFAVVALSFCLAFAIPRWMTLLALVSTVALLYASASGTGIVCLMGLVAYYLYIRFPKEKRVYPIIIVALVTPLFLWKLPEIANRPGLYQSVLAKEGRVDNLKTLLTQANTRQLLIGQGLGFGTNASLTAVKDAPTALPNSGTGEKFSADSTVIALFIQLGIVGVACFYGLLAWAFVRDPRSRPFYLATGIASLAMIITELFPVNLLLGLALAHTLWNAHRDPRKDS
jgi:hypothetical protein